MSTPCKACEVIKTLSPNSAAEFNNAVLERQIAATDAARLLSQHIAPVGQTTIKAHRKAKHLV